jgi:4'-phosphopantetheinyl transferase
LSLFATENQIPKLAPDKILLFVADATLVQQEELPDYLFSWLSPEEQQQYGNYCFEHLRRTFLISRGIMRSVLGCYTGSDPRTISFNTSQKGKPFLPFCRDITFNLSHSDSHIAFAVGKTGPLGVDIETYKPDMSFSELAEKCLSSEEYQHFDRIAPWKETERMKYFLKIWTLKEAYLKALGVGINKSLDKLTFQFRPDNKILFYNTDDEKKNIETPDFILYTGFKDFPLALACYESQDSLPSDRNIQIFTTTKDPEGKGLFWKEKTTVSGKWNRLIN